ncbi:RNA helicase [Coemansia sp. RSA 1933]|nr:RNA helicase [Coemansia sp. RSA 1933]
MDVSFAKNLLDTQLEWFRTDKAVYRRCGLFGISQISFDLWSEKYAQAVRDGKIECLVPKNLVSTLRNITKSVFNDLLVNQFFGFLAKDAPHVVQNIGYLREITDHRYPQDWHTRARSMKRRIVMHVGPTNSGKTYHALQRLKEYTPGVYCSPLRLLAHEIYTKLLSEGIPTTLVTGEEKRSPYYGENRIPMSSYNFNGEPVTQVTSCTVEMAPFDNEYKVGVIDEIQMISDRQRGWAWTDALLGLRAEELHLCGEPSAVPLVKRICASIDEEVEVREYTRLGELEVSKTSLNDDMSQIQKGDCVVTFSRKNIYDTKKEIEMKTGLKCAVIYGALPPEARAKQAQLFNDPDSDYDVVVASDAVGMGINLNIKRVVFMTMSKFDGEVIRPVSISQTRQIGGRAGRYKSGSSVGQVTTFSGQDLKDLGKLMNTQPPPLESAGLQSPSDIIELFSHQFPKIPFQNLWRMFCDIATASDDYFLCNFSSQESIAEIVEEYPLSVRDKYRFLYSPIQTKLPKEVICLRKFAEAVAHKRVCGINDIVQLPNTVPTSREGLLAFEQWHRVITAYLWMSANFAYLFKDNLEALVMKAKCEEILQKGLANIKSTKGFKRRQPPSPLPSKIGDTSPPADAQMAKRAFA